MNILDFIIIYLACGTPFGVYHFIDNRKSNTHWIKSLFTFFVWIPYALRLLLRKIVEYRSKLKLESVEKSSQENETALEQTKKELERILIKNVKNFPGFEFRETAERYIGLTIANYTENEKPTAKEKNLFQISGNDSKILAAKCLHRRNLKLLSFHHNLARRDFLKFVLTYKDMISEAEDFYYLLFKFVRLLQDTEAETIIKNSFAAVAQTTRNETVTQLEKQTWTPEIHKPPPAEPITSPLRTMTAQANLPFKD